MEIGNPVEARKLAQEAVEFYRANAGLFEGVCGGSNLAVAYYSEAMRFLGEGIPIQIGLRLPDIGMEVPIEGQFANEDEATEMIRKVIRDEIERRKSGYA